MRSFSLFFVLSLIHRSRAFTLSLPDKFDAGTQVPVQWTRDGADPTSFGLMQRSLLGNQPVLSVTPVQNSGGATSGTTTVVFDTAGQVLLAVIQQQSLVSGERPNQLAAGKQLTVVQGANNLPVVPIATTSTIVAPPTKTVATATTTTSTKPPQPPQATLSSSKTSTTAASSIVSIGSVGAPESATAAQPSLPSPSSDTQLGPSPSTIPQPSSISSPSPQSSESALPLHASSTKKPRAGVIAAAVLLPLFLLLLLASCWLIRRQRDATRYRVDRFTAVWTRRRRGSARETISSFGGNFNDADDGGAIKSRVSDAERGGEPSSPRTRRQQKLQSMVDHLTERNATLEREMESLSSGSLLPFVGMPAVQSPPPVYVEAFEGEGARARGETEKSRRG